MQEIDDILNWTFIPSSLSGNAERVITSETKRYIRNSINRINQISDSSGTTGSDNQRLLKDVYLLFHENKEIEYDQFAELFSKKDTKLLVWALDYHAESGDIPILFTKDLSLALRLIENKWRESFIISLWHTLLKNWNTLNDYKKQRNQFVTFITHKTEKYSGSRKDILNFNSNSKFLLRADSPSDYAKKVIDKGIRISQAQTLINQKERILFYEYFSNVILHYAIYLDKKSINETVLDEIYEFVTKQNSNKTKLLVCSELINSGKFNQYKKELKSNTISLIGDPIRKDLWMSSELSNKQEQFVEAARQKLNALLNQQFIKIFFEKLVQDKRRKIYWLRFIDKIEDIKFIGNRSNYSYLKNVESISKYVDSRYKTTGGNQSTCALVIYSQGFVFVEFTDTGALYIYKDHSFTVNLNAVSSMANLKIWPTSQWACKNSWRSGYVDLNEEGRITHQGDWEVRFNSWMNRYYKDNFKAKVARSLIEHDQGKDLKGSSKKFINKKTNLENKQRNKRNIIKEITEASYGNLFNSVIRGKNYVPQFEDEQWESKTLYWSKKELQGYVYSAKKDAWWKRKDDD